TPALVRIIWTLDAKSSALVRALARFMRPTSPRAVESGRNGRVSAPPAAPFEQATGDRQRPAPPSKRTRILNHGPVNNCWHSKGTLFCRSNKHTRAFARAEVTEP